MTKYVNNNGVSEMWLNIKNWVTSQLLGYIPKSGTTALSGSIIPDTDNSYDFGSSSYKLRCVYASSVYASSVVTDNDLSLAHTDDNGVTGICGGADGNSAVLLLAGKNYSYLNRNGTFILQASNGNTNSILLGAPDGTLTWNGYPLSISSDYRLKDEIESISDDVLNAWENLEPKQYKLKSDLETDKENAQTHYGWIAQEVESVIKGDRKGEVKNGLWLHEEWEEQEEVSHEETYTEESQTKDGTTETVIKTRKVIDQPYRAKGDSYGLRYTECLVVECAYLRKKNKELQEQLDKLSARLDKLDGVQTK